ncbi:MAG TPA: hypothetical protein VFH68_26090 [Polyangia bacterium]|nr:hypothetical protein [Polyangia bacterium]
MQTKTIAPSLLVVLGAAAFFAAPARADVVAAYVEGHGGVGNNEGGTRSSSSSSSGLSPAIGFQLGARLLIFEGYYDRTAFGSGASVSRGILGLRGGFGGKDLRLVLHAGAGVITEEGGALTGMTVGAAERNGVVGRAGVALERRLMPVLWGGAALDGEIFSLSAATSSTGPRTEGQDAFLSLYLKFELGI